MGLLRLGQAGRDPDTALTQPQPRLEPIEKAGEEQELACEHPHPYDDRAEGASRVDRPARNWASDKDPDRKREPYCYGCYCRPCPLVGGHGHNHEDQDEGDKDLDDDACKSLTS